MTSVHKLYFMRNGSKMVAKCNARISAQDSYEQQYRKKHLTIEEMRMKWAKRSIIESETRRAGSADAIARHVHAGET